MPPRGAGCVGDELSARSVWQQPTAFGGRERGDKHPPVVSGAPDVDEMVAIRKKTRERVPDVGRGLWENGTCAACRGDALERATVTRGGPEQDDAVAVPGATGAVTCSVAQPLRRTAGGRHRLQDAAFEEADRAAVSRPEWRSRR